VHRFQPQLAAIDRAHPYQRKLLVCPDASYGRELLAALARTEGGWVGWEVTTLRGIAEALSLTALANRKLRHASDIEVAGVADEAFASLLGTEGMHASLIALQDDPGTRAALLDVLQELRMGGVSSSDLRATASAFSASLSLLLERYVEALGARALADSAEMFELALQHFDDEFRFTYDKSRLYLIPTWPSIGLAARLRDRLIAMGAESLDGAHEGASARLHVSSLATNNCTDSFHNRNALEFFHASTATDELLVVLRETLVRGARFDEVEIACSNVDSYGVALDALCRRTGIGATMLDGVPLTATRLGRALGRLLDWLDTGFNADVLRRALEAGDFTTGEHSGAALARELRRSRGGWGREHSFRLAQRLTPPPASVNPKATKSLAQGDLFTTDINGAELPETSRRRALAELLLDLLERAPVVRDATHDSDIVVDCAAVAWAIHAMIDRLAIYDASEQVTMTRVRERLEQIAQGIRRETTSAQALAFIRASLIELRAWTSSSGTARPRRATGGHVHLTDLAHAGTTGRPHLFIVGLDSDNVAGPVVQSSLLPDSVRSRFPDALRTIEERRRMRAAQLETAIHSTTAQVCLSYAVAVDVEGAERSPAHQFLETWRAHANQPTAGYDELRDALGEVRSAVPFANDAAVDARDLWLQLMPDPTDPALLRDAERLVRTHHPAIARGLDAIEIRRQYGQPTAWHGLVPDAALLDPRKSGEEISPSSLEAFAACPMRWFYRDALGASVPRDLQFDEARWLDGAQRGTLLHEVFDALCRRRLHEEDPTEGDVLSRAANVLRAVADRFCATVPVPSVAVYEAELRQLEEDVRFFLFDEHARWRQHPWEFVEGEMRFGGDRSVAITLDDGTRLRIRGRVDRVDRTEAGLRITDYKTGKSFFDWNDRVPFAGGRKLQLAVYAAAVSERLVEPVARAEYRFPTPAGGGTTLGVDAEVMPRAMGIVNEVVREISSGRFLPTFDRSDCGFCDFADICRSVPGLYGNDSPRAQWAHDHRMRDEYASMRDWRAKA
jgi:RecB family exonuclease